MIEKKSSASSSSGERRVYVEGGGRFNSFFISLLAKAGILVPVDNGAVVESNKVIETDSVLSDDGGIKNEASVSRQEHPLETLSNRLQTFWKEFGLQLIKHHPVPAEYQKHVGSLHDPSSLINLDVTDIFERKRRIPIIITSYGGFASADQVGDFKSLVINPEGREEERIMIELLGNRLTPRFALGCDNLELSGLLNNRYLTDLMFFQKIGSIGTGGSSFFCAKLRPRVLAEKNLFTLEGSLAIENGSINYDSSGNIVDIRISYKYSVGSQRPMLMELKFYREGSNWSVDSLHDNLLYDRSKMLLLEKAPIRVGNLSDGSVLVAIDLSRFGKRLIEMEFKPISPDEIYGVVNSIVSLVEQSATQGTK